MDWQEDHVDPARIHHGIRRSHTESGRCFMIPGITCNGVPCGVEDRIRDIDAASIQSIVDSINSTAGWILPLVGIVSLIIVLGLGVAVGWILAGGNA